MKTKDICDIIGNKIASDVWKVMTWNIYPPHVAEQICDAIDRKYSFDIFNRFVLEYNEWLAEQQRQKQYLQQFLIQYNK